MKYRTVKNMEKATKIIANKGYDWEEANTIAIQCFDNMTQNNNDMSVEWYIDKIISKEVQGSKNRINPVFATKFERKYHYVKVLY